MTKQGYVFVRPDKRVENYVVMPRVGYDRDARVEKAIGFVYRIAGASEWVVLTFAGGRKQMDDADHPRFPSLEEAAQWLHTYFLMNEPLYDGCMERGRLSYLVRGGNAMRLWQWSTFTRRRIGRDGDVIASVRLNEDSSHLTIAAWRGQGPWAIEVDVEYADQNEAIQHAKTWLLMNVPSYKEEEDNAQAERTG